MSSQYVGKGIFYHHHSQNLIATKGQKGNEPIYKYVYTYV